MEVQINAVLMGGISDFYANDFPGENYCVDQAELEAALGEKVTVE